jgi:DNA (cytosine-5)-methyltransferase 1
LSKRLTKISLFSGAGGLDIGLEQAGFETRVCVEFDKSCQQTLEANRSRFGDPSVSFLHNITEESPGHILEVAGLRPGEATLVSGGPPCQSYSTAGKRGSIVDPRGTLFFQYVDVIQIAQPRFFIMENVRGILSAAIKHRPLHLRKDEGFPLKPDEELGSVFSRIILPAFEQGLGYQVSFGVLNALDYGAAQDRRRLIVIGSRDRELGQLMDRPLIENLVPPTHDIEGTGGRETWKVLKEGLEGLDDPDPEFQKYSDARAKVFDNVPPGKNWRYLRDDPEYGDEYVKKILGGAYDATGGRVGFWRRLSWDRWTPTLTTSPTQKSTGLCHPDETRPLSVKEYAMIQGFPSNWEFAGSTAAKYRQIGNAVPTQLAKSLGRTLVNLVNTEVSTPATEVATAG